MRLDHQYVKVNDGSPSPYSALQQAIDEAMGAWHARGAYDWSSITIRNLPCDNRSPQAKDTHYPNVCWHYAVFIDGPDPEVQADEQPPAQDNAPASLDWKNRPGYYTKEA